MNTDRIKALKAALRIAEAARNNDLAALRRAEKALDYADGQVRGILQKLTDAGVSDEEICDLTRTP